MAVPITSIPPASPMPGVIRPCPCCGRCPLCGQRDYIPPAQPYEPYPFRWTSPQWFVEPNPTVTVTY